MPQLSLSEVKISDSSFVDPNGFVFSYNNQIYRAIYPEQEHLYRSLFENGTIERLSGNAYLVASEISEYKIPENSCNLIIKHKKIEPLSYCVEWCPTMLKRAAVATLQLNISLLQQDCMLQDAYPWNILFESTEPVFIDFTSIVPTDQHLLWPAFQQFINFFLNPLELCSMGKGNIARLLLFDYLNGITVNDVVQNMSSSYIFRHPVKTTFSLLSGVAANRIQETPRLKLRLHQKIASQNLTKENRTLRKNFLSDLCKKLEKINVVIKQTRWKNYYKDVLVCPQSDKKLQAVDNLLTKLQPKRVLDIGCNIGRYSILAAEKNAAVISVDADEYCIENLYKKASSEKLSILPLISDILNPAPSFGFLARQFPSSIERFRSDVVLCLGLMHHLHINGRQSFKHIAQLMSELATRAVIFEYIDITDANINLLDQGRKIEYSFDTVARALGKYFKLTVFDSDRNTRKIILCEK